MAEYYAVLNKAVAGLENKSPDGRRAVYDKARNALIGQLKAIDPPLPTAEISRQRLELEEAIRRIEREVLTGQPAGPSRSSSPPAAQPAPFTNGSGYGAGASVEPSPPMSDMNRRTPQEVFRRAIQEAENRTVAGTPQVEPPARIPPPVERAPPPRPYEAGDRAPGDPRMRERFDREVPRERTPPPVSQQAEPARRPVEPGRPAPPYGNGWERAAPAVQVRSTPSDEYAERVERQPKAGWSQPAPDYSDVMEIRARSSRLPAILLLGLILTVTVGVGALAWSQRAILADILASFDRGSGSDGGDTPVVTAAVEVDPNAGKTNDRLLSNEPGPSVRVVAPGPAGVSLPLPPSAAAPGVALPQAELAALPQPAGPGGDIDALVAQRGVLSEEPTDPAVAATGVVAFDAAVTWSYTDDPVGGPEITANVDVPGRDMQVRLVFRKNSDATLPASHLVEVSIDTSGQFPGGGIGSVPSLRLKSGEREPSQPLIGAAATITDTLFWIALSGAPSDVSTNLGMLSNLGWLDVPMVYSNGQRAILTIEKGIPGERVFSRALTAWAG
jgi:hypothetical protein